MAVSVRTRATADLDAAVAWHGQIVSVTVEGAMDLASACEARALMRDLLERQPSGLIVDTRDAFVDSSGIGVLVQAAQRARQERRDFRLLCHERLAAVLRMHGLSDLLGIGDGTSARRLAA
jgi:anti-anti-sigma factor